MKVGAVFQYLAFFGQTNLKNGISWCSLEGRAKKSKQNDTALFSANSLLFSRIRHGAKLRPCFDDQAQFDVLNLDLKSSQLYFPTSISVMYMISLTTNLRI